MKGITLIGMPGAGKSTIGKMLAKRTGFKFVDLDVLIKEKTGRSHADILENDGEDRLLELENKYTLELDLAQTIFSPGGSIVYSKPAMEKLKNETKITYLELSLSEIKKRLGKNLKTRGIIGLKQKGLEGLFAERTPLYKESAHRTINCSGLSDEEIARALLAK
jgi:shikimate kinase